MEHVFQLTVKWTGNKGQGTMNYNSFDRSHLIYSNDKPDILGSSAPEFRGDPKRWNPEELLVSSLSTCHMLWYLHLCANHKITVMEYSDHPVGIMTVESSGKGYFQKATLNPIIVITDPARIEEAEKLHQDAHEKCFIANSVNFSIEIIPKISG